MKVRGFKKFLLEYSLIILALVVTTLLSIQYYFSYQMVLNFATKRFEYLAKQSSLIVKERDLKAKEIVSILAHSSIVNDANSFSKEKELLKLFITPIKHNNKIFSLYIGYPNSNYFEVVNVKHSPAVAKMFNAPKGARWIVVKVIRKNQTDKIAKRVSHFYDEDLNYISDLNETTKYDPLKRPWFIDAMKAKTVVRGSSYMFYRLKKMGITYSMPIENNKTVIAIDMTLEGLNQFLKELKFDTYTKIYMIEKDKIIASSEGLNKPIDKEILTSLKPLSKDINFYTKDKQEYISMVIPSSTNDASLPILLAFKTEKSQMMKPYMSIIYVEIFVTLILILLIIPLVKHLSKRFLKPINMLMIENEKVKKREFDKISYIDSDIYELNQLSKSLINMSKSIKEYEQKQEKLLEGFIHLIANMIDTKSPYTGEHCKKVPILTNMMIKEANKHNIGNLKSFKINDQELLKGIEWSAWLHDCGKIIVPDYIIDKSTKLETVYNRIHEIRTRFEVLLRDAKIEYLTSIMNGVSKQQAKQLYDNTKQQLEDDFAFIAKINLGETKMTKEDYKRLEEISQITWKRHFNKHLGISWQERELLKVSQDEQLPVTEHLLYDGKEYKIPRKQSDFQLYEQEHIKMDIPTLLYNKGELYNLSISQGTITKEEKFKIQEHAIYTLKILKELPWSDNLKHIVEDGANHHEHLDGTGYPRSLNEDSLSIPARIMAIADIFEALTSTDRPYKKSKTLSQALNIMIQMVKSQKIDAELFELFITSQIYIKFAKVYLKPSQIDMENIDEQKIIQKIKS